MNGVGSSSSSFKGGGRESPALLSVESYVSTLYKNNWAWPWLDIRVIIIQQQQFALVHWLTSPLFLLSCAFCCVHDCARWSWSLCWLRKTTLHKVGARWSRLIYPHCLALPQTQTWSDLCVLCDRWLLCLFGNPTQHSPGLGGWCNWIWNAAFSALNFSRAQLIAPDGTSWALPGPIDFFYLSSDCALFYINSQLRFRWYMIYHIHVRFA